MNKNHLPLIIGISLPIIFIIIISIVIFVPAMSIKPAHNFLYTTDDAYSYNQAFKYSYEVRGDEIEKSPVTLQERQTYRGDEPSLYEYDVKNNSSHKITFDDAKKYTLDPGPSSPDGYTIKYEYNHDGLFELFGSNDSQRGYYIGKDKGKKMLTGLTGDNNYSYYSGNFRLIGWVK